MPCVLLVDDEHLRPHRFGAANAVGDDGEGHGARVEEDGEGLEVAGQGTGGSPLAVHGHRHGAARGLEQEPRGVGLVHRVGRVEGEDEIDRPPRRREGRGRQRGDAVASDGAEAREERGAVGTPPEGQRFYGPIGRVKQGVSERVEREEGERKE